MYIYIYIYIYIYVFLIALANTAVASGLVREDDERVPLGDEHQLAHDRPEVPESQSCHPHPH